MLLYSLLFLARVKAVDPDYEIVGEPAVSLDDIKHFRQLDSKCPGHPEYRWTSGVETTTGPARTGDRDQRRHGGRLGLAGRALQPPRRRAVRLRRLCDRGRRRPDGGGLERGRFVRRPPEALQPLLGLRQQPHHDRRAHLDHLRGRRRRRASQGYQWNVTRVEDANDLDEIARGFDNFQEEQERPTLIIVDSHIGYGAPHKQDTAEAHGEPLGDEEVRETKRFYGWPEDAEFLVPDGVQERFAEVMGKRGAELRAKWDELFESYRADEPENAAHLEEMQRRELPEGWDADLPSFEADEKGMATRKASNKVENAVAAKVPWLLVGRRGPDRVELGRARRTAEPFEPSTRDGRQLHYGIREHESAAISNGLSLSKLRPLWSTYLTFSDYARPAIRLSALMELPVIHLFTHDSIGLGEDGPTHQPVEQLASLRAIPGLDVIRPADANEVTEAWRAAMDRHHQPVALVLTRQDVPIIDRSRYASADGLRRGGYVLADPEDGDPEVILIATGSEVALALGAHEKLISDGVRSRVVSLPCWELFERQEQSLSGRGAARRRSRRGSRSRRPLPWVGTDSSVPRERRSECTPSAPPHR